MSEITVADFFSGIGGFSLGLGRAGDFKTVAFCEIEEFPRRVLAKHWPEVPCYHDVRTIRPPKADVYCGGFPCQPFSTASRGHRTAIDLWPEFRDVIKRGKPRYVIAENVQEAAISRAASDMRNVGYRTYYRRISADDCGADHQRDRWWAIAYPDDQSELPSRIDAEVAKLPELCRGLWGPSNYARAVRISDGISDRVHRLKGLGNAVLPQIPQAIGKAIASYSKDNHP